MIGLSPFLIQQTSLFFKKAMMWEMDGGSFHVSFLSICGLCHLISHHMRTFCDS
jgi:hypothetical protein